MIKKILIFLLLIISINLSCQEYGEKKIYLDFGLWSTQNNDSEIKVHAYITQQPIIKCKDHEINNKTTSKVFFRYELVVSSLSRIDSTLTNTWFYGTKIFVNGDEITNDIFPRGFIASINVIPTTLYIYESESEKISMRLEWEDAVAEPRITLVNKQ